MDAEEREKITRILAAAAAAPSGDNSQPWRFVVRGKSIEFHYIPERDHPILNYEESGTLIALGAALENAELTAKAQGYAPQTTYRASGPCVAVMELAEGGRLSETAEPLARAVPERHSNRKAYDRASLQPGAKAALLASSISESAELALAFVESPDAMRAIARALTTMEETALANVHLHKLFFDDILWSAEENRAGKQGLYIKTLELPPPAQVLFRFLRHWRFARMLAALGFPRVVAETNAKQNAAAAAFGVISAAHAARAEYLEVGRMVERVWLRATALGLSMQIVTGITFLARSLRIPEIARLFSRAEQERIVAAHAIIKENVDETREPILIFRIGRGDAPTEVSYRRAPEIVFA